MSEIRQSQNKGVVLDVESTKRVARVVRHVESQGIGDKPYRRRRRGSASPAATVQGYYIITQYLEDDPVVYNKVQVSNIKVVYGETLGGPYSGTGNATELTLTSNATNYIYLQGAISGGAWVFTVESSVSEPLPPTFGFVKIVGWVDVSDTGRITEIVQLQADRIHVAGRLI